MPRRYRHFTCLSLVDSFRLGRSGYVLLAVGVWFTILVLLPGPIIGS